MGEVQWSAQAARVGGSSRCFFEPLVLGRLVQSSHTHATGSLLTEILKSTRAAGQEVYMWCERYVACVDGSQIIHQAQASTGPCSAVWWSCSSRNPSKITCMQDPCDSVSKMLDWGDHSVQYNCSTGLLSALSNAFKEVNRARNTRTDQ